MRLAKQAGNSLFKVGYRCRNTMVTIKRSIFGLILLAAFHATMGQEKRIHLKGILTAKNGDPIPGCNVVLKGESMGATTTQACGEFEISVPDDHSGVLVFACLAPRVWEIPIKKLKNKDKIIISLTDWDKFDNGPCERNYDREKKIKIH